MRMIAEGLSGERGGEPVFSGISFALADGEGLLVTGPNGSGKSTLLRIVAGLLPSAGGSIEIADADVRWPDIASACHYLGHQNALKPALSVRENLGFWRDYMGEPHLAVTEALEMVGLDEIGHLPLGYLSTGQKRRIAIARLLVSYRPVWLLDEPTAGVSPIVMDELFDRILEVRDTGLAILMVEQNARQALNIADRGYVLVSGENWRTGTGHELLANPEVRKSFLGG